MNVHKLKTTAKVRRRIAVSMAVLAFITLSLWYIGVIGGNVHEVVNGRAYRSAQLTGGNLDTVLTDHKIKSVIDLRGGSMSDPWYRSEISECREHNAAHYDVTMSARRLPPPATLEHLFKVFDEAKYPVLFHCRAGSDRTGLVATLYLNVYHNVPLDQAEKQQLTWRYGHFSFGETHAMDDFFALYRKTNGGLNVRDWVSKLYPAIYEATKAGEEMDRYKSAHPQT